MGEPKSDLFAIIIFFTNLKMLLSLTKTLARCSMPLSVRWLLRSCRTFRPSVCLDRPSHSSSNPQQQKQGGPQFYMTSYCHHSAEILCFYYIINTNMIIVNVNVPNSKGSGIEIVVGMKTWCTRCCCCASEFTKSSKGLILFVTEPIWQTSWIKRDRRNSLLSAEEFDSI